MYSDFSYQLRTQMAKSRIGLTLKPGFRSWNYKKGRVAAI
jgi:hypothetical protein